MGVVYGSRQVQDQSTDETEIHPFSKLQSYSRVCIREHRPHSRKWKKNTIFRNLALLIATGELPS